MSSPLSNLRKGRKIPLQSSNKTPEISVPFRNTPLYSADESKLLDEISGNIASDRLHKTKHVGSDSMVAASHDGSRGTPGDFELMGSMMSRIARLEQQVQYQAKEISAKDKKIKILEEKTSILNKARASEHTNKVQELEKKCLLLQQQVHEMESFLADYGMVWVGEKEDPDSDVYHEEAVLEPDEGEEEGGRKSVLDLSKTWNPATSLAQFQMDYDLVLENIKELNALAGDGIAKIQHTTDGARLRMTDPIQLTLYANGILMFRGPFRSFSDPSTQHCMRDIMDGYFPSELQDRYPEGVPFEVTDKRNVHFRDRLEGIFEGSGQLLGGDTKPSRLVPSVLNKSLKNTEESEIPGPKLTMDQFLHKIPKSVIKGGKVVNIRESLGETLTGNQSGKPALTVVDTPAAQELVNRLEQNETERPPSSREITTLRIKSAKGDNTYILKMKFSDTLGDVRKCLNKQRGLDVVMYDIVSAFPQKAYSEDTMTLKQCGLIPNATLHLKPRKWPNAKQYTSND